MIEKLITIKNVAKFRDFNCSGDIEFRKLNLIYAENAKGKSSIAAIFRSLSTGDSSSILAKQTIGITDTPYVKIKYEGGIAEFKNQAWTQILPELLIYDSFYVTSNIFSGDHITHDHKKNLYYLLIGEKSVKFAQRIEDLDAEIRELGKQIPDIEKDIKRSNFGNIDTDNFLILDIIADVDEQIAKQTAILESLKRALEIQSTPALSPIITPEIDIKQLEVLLKTTFEEVSKDVEEKFRHHCERLGENSETWIREGLDFSKNLDNRCPFCGEITSASELVRLYSQYFSEQYSRLKYDIQEFSLAIDNTLSPDVLLSIQKQISDNVSKSSFWKIYIEEKYPEMDFSNVKKVADQILSQAKTLLSKKFNTPLERIALTTEFIVAVREYEEVIELINAHNAETERINASINQKKDDVKVQSSDEAQQRLILLQNTKVRYEPFMIELCGRYTDFTTRKEALTQEKATARGQLDTETEEVMGKHQELLNALLGNFGIEFQIHKTETSMIGGKPSVSYSLFLNGENIPLGSDETLDRPGFKTTLSDGEKNSLAFAFFLAQVFQNPELGNKIIVIDDPITSLDEQRRLCTKHEILKIANAAKQVIVLSHDPMFLKDISEGFQSPKSLIIKRCPQGSTIEEWDIEAATQSRYLKNYGKLKNYLERNEGDMCDVALCIRPILEGNVRMRFPDEFTPKEMLGQFIDKIKTAKVGEPLSSMQGKVEELNNINDYSKRFHHETDTNFSANRNNVTDAELKPWVKRTIEFIRSS